MPIRDALSAYAGPTPRFVVPICSLPSRRSLAWSIATCHGMIRCALPGHVHLVGGIAQRLETVELLDQHLGVDDAAVADDARLAVQDAGRDLADLERFVADHDRMPRVRTALVAADEIRLLGEQVDDLPFAFVAPLRSDDDGRGHEPKCALRDG